MWRERIALIGRIHLQIPLILLVLWLPSNATSAASQDGASSLKCTDLQLGQYPFKMFFKSENSIRFIGRVVLIINGYCRELQSQESVASKPNIHPYYHHYKSTS